MSSLFPDLQPGNSPDPGPNTAGSSKPLAAQLAPRTFDDYCGQTHLIGADKPLRQLIERDALVSMILWGPPGVGKTALARLMARQSKSVWIALNAVMSKVQELREAIAKAKANQQLGKRTVLFVDEIHRFNKAQQDALLPDVEKGTVILIGATTENPFFSVNGSILSRCQVFELYPLADADLAKMMGRALKDESLASLTGLSEVLKDQVLRQSQGDGRRLMNLLEMLAKAVTPGQSPNEDTLAGILQRKGTLYRSDEHYDIISAFIKSVRGSDVNAALYWLARMIRGGEDPRFIARRLLILASEDIGNADPNALTMAINALQTVQFIGWPEAKYTLSQVTIYLAQAPKSNQATTAINSALAYVDEGNLFEVPVHLRSKKRPEDPNKEKTDYIYTHDHPDAKQMFWDGDRLFTNCSINLCPNQ